MPDIVRTVKNSGYCMMSNFHLTDRRLSWKAKGLLSTLLALSGEYTAIGELVHLVCDGKITEEGLAELEKYGYIRQFSLNGTETEYTIYEKPFTKESSQHSALELPSVEDMPVKALSPEESKEEEQISFRKRLKNAMAFEAVCLAIWDRQHSEQICSLSGLINMYLDNIMLGIKAASGGNEPVESQGMKVRE